MRRLYDLLVPSKALQWGRLTVERGKWWRDVWVTAGPAAAKVFEDLLRQRLNRHIWPEETP